MTPYLVDTSHSPAARLKPVPVSAVRFSDGFWKNRLHLNQTRGIPRLFGLLEDHGVLDNFQRLYGAHDGPRRGFLYTDSDLYKWMEGAAIALQSKADPDVRDLLERAIATILPAQRADGYLNTWFVDEREHDRWTNLGEAHELYCAGHLFQAAVAHYRVDGDRRLLDCALRFADHIDNTFRVPQQPGAPGHPEIELALIELYRATQESRYLALAGYFLEQRGVADRTTIHGHAVRAAYFMSGAMDYYLETGHSGYIEAIHAQWADLIAHKIYVTGGIGGRYEGESVGNDHELPNERAYAETCAAIAAMMWNWRLLQAGGDARFTDWLERTLYNGFLAGVALSGDEYFYINPLASSGKDETDPWYPWAWRASPRRLPWYECTCCPPNAQRFLASLPIYFYSTSAEGLWVHLFDNNTMEWRLPDGSTVTVVQQTDYPWSGNVRLKIASDSSQPFALFVRIPGWAEQATATLNGSPVANVQPGAYLQLNRLWRDDTLELNFDMPVELTVTNQFLASNRGQVAIRRGPLVYCLESVDHEGQDARYLIAREESIYQPRHEPDLLGGVTTITTDGLKCASCQDEPLYLSLTQQAERVYEPTPLKFIPYYAWANRGLSSMTVWVQSQ